MRVDAAGRSHYERGMRFFLLACGLVGVVAVAAPEAARLEKIKREFPGHTVGPVTARSDPAVVQCFRKYERKIGALEMDGLAQQIQRLKDDIAQEIREIDWRLQDPKNRIKSSTRFAEEKNGSWLKMKLQPYVKRLVLFQRGR